MASNFQLKQAQEEAAKEDGHPTGKLVWQGFELYMNCRDVIKGLKSAKITDGLMNAGVECKGFDFVQFLPTSEELLDETVPAWLFSD